MSFERRSLRYVKKHRKGTVVGYREILSDATEKKMTFLTKTHKQGLKITYCYLNCVACSKMIKEQFNGMKNHKTIRLVDFKSPQRRPIDDVK